MRIEERVFAQGMPAERRMLVMIVDSVQEHILLDKVFGDKVGENGHIADVVGSVQLSDTYGEHYIRLETKESYAKHSNRQKG